MKTSNLKSLIIEFNRLSGIDRYCIYNKYSTFLTKNKIDVFRDIFYFLRFNFEEELSFFRKGYLELLVKLLLSKGAEYILSPKIRESRGNRNDILSKNNTYVINYLRNEFKLFEISNKYLIFKIDDINKLYHFIKFMDDNYFSLMRIENNKNIFTIKILVFFYDENFDINKIIDYYYGEIIG